jgi:hypothetical protein
VKFARWWKDLSTPDKLAAIGWTLFAFWTIW